MVAVYDQASSEADILLPPKPDSTLGHTTLLFCPSYPEFEL